ncbi:TauD/TfdA family dioxygenase [Streptomyces fuscichromogenes]|uniref:TauD/TfdA family dioxygenase n=1 Tax=Streptomyces fuscichromogenes TaxID=1324013 RepID=UPI00382F3695
MSTGFHYTDLRSTGISLRPDETTRLEQVAQHIAHECDGRSLHDADLLHAVELATAALPPTVRKALISFRDKGNAAGCLLLTGLPVGPLPATPDSDEREPAWWEVPVPTLSQLMVMSVLGRSLAYSDEKLGNLVQDICPKKGAERRQENSGSVLLDLHTEDAFHPHPPHFVSLLCLRGDRDDVSATVTAGMGDVRPLLDAQTVDALREPEFRTRFSTSFVSDRTDAVQTGPMPVLTGADECPDLRVSFHGTVAVTPRARAALGRLRLAMERSLKGLVLQPGDLVVLDNRRAVHGRTAITPYFDGMDRWLRRSFAVTDLRPVNGRLGEGRRYRPVTGGHLGTDERCLPA